MKSLPLPAILAATAAIAALPFSLAAAGTLFLTAWLGLIIHSDYVLRRRPAPIPRHTWRKSHAYFRRFAAGNERHQLAA